MLVEAMPLQVRSLNLLAEPGAPNLDVEDRAELSQRVADRCAAALWNMHEDKRKSRIDHGQVKNPLPLAGRSDFRACRAARKVARQSTNAISLQLETNP
jgi:hypothetical protein